MTQRQILHIVEPDSRARAEFARLVFALGHHVEVYGDLDELLEHPPRDGVIFVPDATSGNVISPYIELLATKGIWLPVVAMGENPEPRRIVGAVKAGAMDFLALPLEEDRLKRIIARIAADAETHGESRRRAIEARQRISSLSTREREVLDWLAQGSSNKAIARALEISPRTVEIHRANMMTKLGAAHSAEAVRLRIEAERSAPEL